MKKKSKVLRGEVEDQSGGEKAGKDGGEKSYNFVREGYLKKTTKKRRKNIAK